MFRRAWLLVVVAAGLTAFHGMRSDRPSPPGDEGDGPVPSDWFGAQRAFPGTEIPEGAWLAAVERARVDVAAMELSTSADLLTWTEAGPTNIGGRVTAIAAHRSGSPAYFGAANGGVFRSTNFGVHWTPIFDAVGVPSIGALAVSPQNANVLYVGTGEANAAIDNYDGAGLFRTTDAGASWQHLGLGNVGRIGRIAIDPTNPNRIYVAAMGRQFSTGPDRGLYHSTNGGVTWTRTLFVNDSTGVCDVLVNPARPETLLAASWERIRRPSYRRVYGPGGGVWRSIDYGVTWTKFGDAQGLPTPSDAVGRIGLAISPSQPSTIYAQIIAGSHHGLGFYRSTNDGTTWTKRDVSGFTGGFGGFGWYFGDAAVHPTDPNRVWALGVNFMSSTDGGVNFSGTPGPHVDYHALWISPQNPSLMYAGNDGGVYWSTDAGASWNFPASLPITQFYAGTIDPSNPARLLGGTQDNHTLITPVGAPNGWNAILGGDGFYCLVDPVNPNIVFAEYQNGSGRRGPQRSNNNGLTFAFPSGFDSGDRFNWCMPFTMSPSDRNVMLAGTHRVYRSLDNGVSYVPISGDLTTAPAAALVYGTITTLDISAVAPDLYLAGTDDGRVWRTTNAGGNWTEIGASLPRRWVTRVVADPLDAQVVYVTLSGFSADEQAAHVFRSSNLGTTWTAIDAGLPNAPANDLIVAPWDTRTLFVGTDVGVYVTRDRGGRWFRLGQGMPIQVVADLSLHAPSRTLVAATHGRSQWKIDLAELPVAVEDRPPVRLTLAPPRPNPSRGAVGFAIGNDAPTHAEIAIYDAMGRRVRVLHSGALGPGRHAFTWDGDGSRGRRVAAGVYFVRVSTGDWHETRRLVRVD